MSMQRKHLLWILALAFLVNSCTAQSKKDYVVTIKTQFGDMVAILYDETPKHKENFIKLANGHFYDSLLFHRVIEGFMIQGGDPDSKRAPKGQRLGQGGPGYTIDAEINPRFVHEKGALSAARLGDQMNPSKASSGSQFYIVQGKKLTEQELKMDPQKMNEAFQQFFRKPENKKYYDSIGTFIRKQDNKGYENYISSLKSVVEAQMGTSLDRKITPEALKAYTTEGGAPHLDGQYTVFGKVIMGLDVIDKIASQPKDGADRPLQDIRMTITVEELPRKKIEKMYGYQYPVALNSTK
jgi:peptidyl-prolyl cis-trans isomerase B (cyclophilin B)